jgi:uncharacterized protein (DUF1778 family)
MDSSANTDDDFRFVEEVPIILSPADWELLIATLENPPPPNEYLKRLMADVRARQQAS